MKTNKWRERGEENEKGKREKYGEEMRKRRGHKHGACIEFGIQQLTCSNTGPKLDFIWPIFPKPFSKSVGMERNLKVWPVGAVSNTTTENWSSLTNLGGRDEVGEAIILLITVACEG